jgi:hypothetical protein
MGLVNNNYCLIHYSLFILILMWGMNHINDMLKSPFSAYQIVVTDWNHINIWCMFGFALYAKI